ncbi:MAG TPA: hypothetical protein VF131_28175 [Blastocatellia bacterium]|nr:hypothetical protein [Blastocatellia bacterium]
MWLKARIICALGVIFLLTGLTAIAPAKSSAAPQDKDKSEKSKKEKDDKDKSDKKDKSAKSDAEEALVGDAVLWREPTDIESRDLFHGAGGAEGAPNPSGTFTFVKRDTGGTSEKIIVKDEKGREWSVKFGAEARPETSASRIVWAAGYHVDQNYFVKEAHIEGRGGFDVWDVRFERKDDGFKTLANWAWLSNAFSGKRELQGLKVLMALINNWDIKDVNNKIIRPNKESGGDRNARIYYVSDLGGTLGSTGNALSKIPGFGNVPAGSKGKPDQFANQVFIDGVQEGKVVFHYEGKHGEVLEGVSVEDARWMGDLLGRLSDKQLSDAFRAGGFTDAEVAIYVKAMRDRINQLKNLR